MGFSPGGLPRVQFNQAENCTSDTQEPKKTGAAPSSSTAATFARTPPASTAASFNLPTEEQK